MVLDLFGLVPFSVGVLSDLLSPAFDTRLCVMCCCCRWPSQ